MYTTETPQFQTIPCLVFLSNTPLRIHKGKPAFQPPIHPSTLAVLLAANIPPGIYARTPREKTLCSSFYSPQLDHTDHTFIIYILGRLPAIWLAGPPWIFGKIHKNIYVAILHQSSFTSSSRPQVYLPSGCHNHCTRCPSSQGASLRLFSWSPSLFASFVTVALPPTS